MQNINWVQNSYMKNIRDITKKKQSFESTFYKKLRFIYYYGSVMFQYDCNSNWYAIKFNT